MATNTSKYGLKKPSEADFYDVNDQNGNMDIIDTKMMDRSQITAANDFLVGAGASESVKKTLAETKTLLGISTLNTLPTTTGTSTAFVVALTDFTLVAGQRFTAKFHAAGTGSPTAAVNGTAAKTLKKGDGTSVFLPKSGGTYTFVYDGTNFVLQGEGASGNAVASDLLTGKTMSTDAGEITGTMANRAGVTGITPYSYYGVSGTLVVVPQWGYYNDGANIYISDLDFTSANFPEDKNIFGLQGAIPVQGNQEHVGWQRATVGDPAGNGRVHLQIPRGLYRGAGNAGEQGVFCDHPDFIQANILSTANPFGLRGTVPVRTNADTGGGYPIADNDSMYDGVIHLMPPRGYYDGTVWLRNLIPNLNASNIKKDVTIGVGSGGKIVGTLEPLLTAQGTFTLPASMLSYSAYPISMNLSFTPKMIMIMSLGETSAELRISNPAKVFKYNVASWTSLATSDWVKGFVSVDGVGVWIENVSSTSFSLKSGSNYTTTGTFRWVAIG